ncbi:ABC transporter ATP-binding protein [Rhizobium sp. S152]|uniref:ABC transporter ATP-binding protein n=1 Tax=Rhizobium sp. S152 TaxID=3055038 RepID=UPI0025A98B3E|nr:ABC transporter ATP-binding protein [Rhizobium sp. S152]MDM9627531.1 ABC transporter ATP-binding protein [Rhizobium sp. S152]
MPEGQALSLHLVNAYYGDSHILQDVSFGVGQGQVLALLGRNGAGKTTCMNTIAGLITPKSGSISTFGSRIGTLVPEAICRAGVALVPQGRRIFRSLTVTENLTVAASKTVDGDRTRWDTESIYGLFPRLGERRNHSAGLLSGGEQQMLAIGRALMTAPRVLLLDEPTEGLAPQIVSEVGKIITRLKATGMTIILVEQHTSFALNLADEVAVISTGEIVLQGTAAEITRDQAALERHLGVH